MNKRELIVFMAGLPILLHVYNPSMNLGGFGIFLGFWGMFVSPIAIFGYLLYQVINRKERSD